MDDENKKKLERLKSVIKMRDETKNKEDTQRIYRNNVDGFIARFNESDGHSILLSEIGENDLVEFDVSPIFWSALRVTVSS